MTGTCCSFNTPPWFTKQLPSPTDDPIELRNCGDQGQGDENIGTQLLEVYVQYQLLEVYMQYQLLEVYVQYQLLEVYVQYCT